MKVREGKIEDIEQLVAIMKQTYNIHYKNRKDIFKKKEIETMKEWIRSEMDNKEKYILVAEENKTIYGVLIYKIKKIQNNINLKDCTNIWIDEICVDEKYRSQGIGKLLINEIKRIAKKLKYNKIELNCWEFNERARKFYKENGFESQRRIMEINL